MPVSEHEDLFIRKLRLCCLGFDFMDPMADLKGKEMKRAALNELIEFICNNRGILTEPVYPEIIKVVSRKYGFTCKEIDNCDNHSTALFTFPHCSNFLPSSFFLIVFSFHFCLTIFGCRFFFRIFVKVIKFSI